MGLWAWALLARLMAAAGLNNGVGLTPAMGFSTWNHFQERISDGLIRQLADAMAANGLRDAGYVYLNVDDGWAVGRSNATGEIIPDPKLFPNGMKSLADYVHSRGLRFGIYTARGSRTCLGRPGSDGYEAIDARTYAQWGVDYLKEDSCGGTEHGTIWEQYVRMRDALNATGRPIYFSVTQLLPYTDAYPDMHCYGSTAFTTFPWTAQGLDVRQLANSYLVEYCNNADVFGHTGGVPGGGMDAQGFLNNLDAQQYLTYDNLTAPGSWNDNDMLEVCNGMQTYVEYRSQFATWCILASPLILGNDVRTLSPQCKEIVLNGEAIAVNQDPLGIRGRVAYQSDPVTKAIQVYSKRLHDGSVACVVFNRAGSTTSFTVTWPMLGLAAGTTTKVRDLWLHQDVATGVRNEYNVTVVSHDSAFLRFSPSQ
eukprot:TRINITY_DN13011_c0_g1_i1.p1 TRINITY_DN13011_c0_g1~~TRINITY_DN13011_c0_g1_i1.p1  ORF type:complete len:424 (+),score=61.20 TRINITY_DN13011_c0_g1_i1:49-1320(+)